MIRPRWLMADLRSFTLWGFASLPGSENTCCAKTSVKPDYLPTPGNLFDCATLPPSCVAQGRKGRFAMFETMTAVMGLIGAGIFLAHAFDGIRSWI
jgi:hypothetical protein